VGKNLAGTQKSKQSPSLFDEASETQQNNHLAKELVGAPRKRIFGPIKRKGTELFSIPAIRETTALLPEFPTQMTLRLLRIPS